MTPFEFAQKEWPLIAVAVAEEIVAELTEGQAHLHHRGRRWVNEPLSDG